MKKFLSIILATAILVLSCLTVVSCGGANEPSQTGEGGNSQTNAPSSTQNPTETAVIEDEEYGKPYVLYFSPNYKELDSKLLNDLQLFISEKMSETHPEEGIFAMNYGDLDHGTWDFNNFTTENEDGNFYHNVIWTFDGVRTTFYFPEEVFKKIEVILMRSADYDRKVNHYRYKYYEKNVYDENELRDLRGALVEAILKSPDRDNFVDFCSNYDFSKYDNFGETFDETRLTSSGTGVIAVNEASAYNYVLTKAESGKRSEIVDFKNYCDDILFFEDELRNGSLKGLIDDFDYILPEELSYSYFGFHAFKDGEETSYIFDLSSSSVGSYALTHDFQMNLHEVTNAMREGKLNKSNFNMCYKTSDLARYLYNLAKDKVKEALDTDKDIQSYIKNGYNVFITPVIEEPKFSFKKSEYEKNTSVSTISLYDGNNVIQLSKSNKGYVFTAYVLYKVCLVDSNGTSINNYSVSIRYRSYDSSGEMQEFLTNIGKPSNFLSNNSAVEIIKTNDLTQANIYVSNSSVSEVVKKYNLFDISNNNSKYEVIDNFSIPNKNDSSSYNYFNYSLGRLDDSTYEKYIGE